MDDHVYFEYRCDGMLLKCFKTREEAFKHAKAEFNKWPNKEHRVYRAALSRTCIGLYAS